MAASLLGSGGGASIPIGATAASPAILYDQKGAYGVDADQGAPEAYYVFNEESSGAYVHLNVPQMHKDAYGVVIGPGESITLVFRSNFIKAIRAWATTTSSGTIAVAAVVHGGFQAKA